jgi:hypothetical protein
MSIANHFYNGTTRKYVTIFGTIFNKMSITREDNQGNELQRMVVPISYGPYQKFLARLIQDPNLDQKSAITLPRMAFEIMSMNYDGQRKVGSLTKSLPNAEFQTESGRNLRYAPAPYNLEFSLYIMTKYSEDGTKILEQILPFFKPEYTTSVNLIDGLPPIDIPLILNSVSVEDAYEGDFETRRVMMWTLSFTMKGFYFGPVRNKRTIKFIDVNMYNILEETPTSAERITIQPGLTANNQPTTDINETIPYEQIDFGDDWGVITIVTEGEDE